ncbi:hypothetical protein FJY94_03010 [Candidatus Kaiserbacteria bacterium]|nr:hypothetical protein [Candidatus Kaiserbacteria bacterium]
MLVIRWLMHLVTGFIAKVATVIADITLFVGSAYAVLRFAPQTAIDTAAMNVPFLRWILASAFKAFGIDFGARFGEVVDATARFAGNGTSKAADIIIVLVTSDPLRQLQAKAVMAVIATPQGWMALVELLLACVLVVSLGSFWISERRAYANVSRRVRLNPTPGASLMNRR